VLVVGIVLYIPYFASVLDLLSPPQRALFVLGSMLIFVWRSCWDSLRSGRRSIATSAAGARWWRVARAGWPSAILFGVIQAHHLRTAVRRAGALACCSCSSWRLPARCPRLDREGDLLAIDERGPWLTIAHDDIPGLMPAMTMRVPARSPAVIGGVEAGSRVRFGLVREGGRLVVTRLERLGDAAGATRMEVQDQTPHHGGVVAMAGVLHVEAAASRDGRVRLWLTDESRQPVSLAGASGEVRIVLPDGERRVPIIERGLPRCCGPGARGDGSVPGRAATRQPARRACRVAPGGVAPWWAGAGWALYPGHGRAGAAELHGAPSPSRTACWRSRPRPTAGRRGLRRRAMAHGAPAGEVLLSFQPPPPAEVAVVEGSEPDVGGSSIALRSDGAEAAIAFGPRLVRYQVATGRVVRELPPAGHAIRDLAWSPDGARLLVSVLGEPDARLLDAETGALERPLRVAQEAAGVAFRGDGGLAAVGSEVGPIAAFDPHADGPLRPIADVLQPVEDLAFAGSRIVWAGADRTLRVWDDGGASLTQAELPAAAVRLAVAPGGSVVAVALRGGTIELRRVDDGSLIEALRFHTSGVRAVAWAGSLLVSGDTDGTRALWDLAGVPGGPRRTQIALHGSRRVTPPRPRALQSGRGEHEGNGVNNRTAGRSVTYCALGSPPAAQTWHMPRRRWLDDQPRPDHPEPRRPPDHHDILWWTNVAGDSTVEYARRLPGSRSTSPARVRGRSRGTCHAVTLTPHGRNAILLPAPYQRGPGAGGQPEHLLHDAARRLRSRRHLLHGGR
jgi:hypothetical protein